MSGETREIVVALDAPCICENGKPFGECCGGAGGPGPKVVLPNPPKTGVGEPKCHLRSHLDCWDGPSRDHVISRVVLGRLTAGLPLKIVAKNQVRSKIKIDSDSIQTKWLCRRHNSAMSPLDDQGARLFDAVQRHLYADSASTERKLVLFYGFDIERWIIKTLLATYHTNWSVDKASFSLPAGTSDLFHVEHAPPLGLYIPRSADKPKPSQLYPGFRPPIACNLITEGAEVVGAEVSFGPLRLRMFIGGSPTAIRREAESSVYRPKGVMLINGANEQHLWFRWRMGTNESLEFHMGPTPPQASKP